MKMCENFKRTFAVCAAVLFAFVLMNHSPGIGAVLLEDNFDSGFNQQKWFVRAWNPDGSTYIDGTQLRVAPYRPPVHDGYLDLVFSTYNPTALTPGDSFFGSQIVSVQQFAPKPNEAVKFTTRARFVPPAGRPTVPGGIIGSMFVYELVTSTTRDEIDVEVLTKAQPEGPGYLTNVFDREPFSASGDVEFIPISGFDLREFHEYSFIWAVDSISWYIDNRLVRRELQNIPETAADMPLIFNTWAPLFGGFQRALDPTLQPARTAATNIDVIWRLDFARVETVSPPLLGDYNGNGTVDAADYVVWRKRPAALLNEGVSLGVIDQADYSFWRSRFGARPTAGAAFDFIVPEPTFATLAFAVVLCACCVRCPTIAHYKSVAAKGKQHMRRSRMSLCGKVIKKGMNLLSCWALSFVLLGPPQAEAAFVNLWKIGENDSSVAGMGSESRTANPPPGSPDVRDDDYYFAGQYAFGNVPENERLGNFEHSLTYQDEENRIHFPLSPQLLARGGAQFQLQFGTVWAGSPNSGPQDWVILFNGTQIWSEFIGPNRDVTADPFTAASVLALASDNVITMRRKPTPGTSAWLNIDYVHLAFELAGDYNADGKVDSLDYETWRSSYGQFGPALSADGNHDGTVDAADYVIWRRSNSGSTFTSSSSWPVPEPSSKTPAILVILAAYSEVIRKRS
jgi:Glycosyl hydrolases family 16